MAVKNAYCTPLMVCVVKLTADPPKVIELKLPAGVLIGNMACKFLAPVPTAMVKFNWLTFHDNDPNEEPLRPSSHVNSCCDDTMGTPCACAEETTSGPIPG